MDTKLDATQLDHGTWKPPEYEVPSDGTAPPLLSQINLGPSPGLGHNFGRMVQWCTDGSTALIQCENSSFQLFDTNSDTGEQASFTLACSRTFPQPAPIVDSLWFPGASRHHPAAYCFVASVRECPVKLLDGNDGRLRASYPIVDHRERQIAPHSLSFNPAGDKLYCGFQDAIEIFDIQRPGAGDRLRTTPSKKSKDGLKGIVSALSFSPAGTYFAAGTLTPASHTMDNIALYDVSIQADGMQVLSVGGVSMYENGGVVQLAFSPADQFMLYAAFRRSPRVWAWDLRDASAPLCCFESGSMLSAHACEEGDGKEAYDTVGEMNSGLRFYATNQKMHFDIDRGGRWMGVGDQAGNIAIYDLHASSQPRKVTDDIEQQFRHYGTGSTNEASIIRPTLAFKAHGDAIGAVAFHPLQSVLLSVAGSRHFNDAPHFNPSLGNEDDPDTDTDSDSSSDIAEDGPSRQGSHSIFRRITKRPMPTVVDASMRLWDFGMKGL